MPTRFDKHGTNYLRIQKTLVIIRILGHLSLYPGETTIPILIVGVESENSSDEISNMQVITCILYNPFERNTSYIIIDIIDVDYIFKNYTSRVIENISSFIIHKY